MTNHILTPLLLLALGSCGQIQYKLTSKGPSVKGQHLGSPFEACAFQVDADEKNPTLVSAPIKLPGEDRSYLYLIVITDGNPEFLPCNADGSARTTESGAQLLAELTLHGVELDIDCDLQWGNKAEGEDHGVSLSLGCGGDPTPIDLSKGRVFSVDAASRPHTLKQWDIELPRGFQETPDRSELLERVASVLGE